MKIKNGLITSIVYLWLTLPLLNAAGSQFISGHVPAAIKLLNLKPVGRLNATNRLALVVGLPLRNMDTLTNLLRQFYDPRSTSYGHYLSPEQFTKMFGPGEDDYKSLNTFIKTNGLTVVKTYSNRTIIDVTASVADIERVFHTTISIYQHPKENRTFFAPDAEPTLDLNTRVLHIAGLDNYFTPHKNITSFSSGNTASFKPNVGSEPYKGNAFRKAYAIPDSLNGSGQVVGLLEEDGYCQKDISAYEAESDLQNVPLENILLDGFDGSAGADDVEDCMDIELVAAMAPGLSEIVVYEAPSGDRLFFGNPYYLDILCEMANPSQGEPLPNQLSSSWVLESNPIRDDYFLQFAMQRQSFFLASGDMGAYYPGITEFADSPFVTIVGGTALTTSTDGSWVSETTWQLGGGESSGGGISQTYQLPFYQEGINMTVNQGSSNMRNVPDVSMVATNILVYFNGKDNPNGGGTSAAAPLWAGFMALVNQQAEANGLPAIGQLNPVLYSICEEGNYSSETVLKFNNDMVL